MKIKWLDAWIVDDITLEEIQAGINHTTCTIVGTLIWEDATLVAVAAEKVKNYNDTISWRAVTFIPKSLILETEELGG